MTGVGEETEEIEETVASPLLWFMTMVGTIIIMDSRRTIQRFDFYVTNLRVVSVFSYVRISVEGHDEI